MLKERLKKEQKTALKSGDTVRRTLIGMVMTSIKNKEIEKRTKLSKTINDPAQLDTESQLTEDEMIDVIASEVKRRKDSIVEFKKGGRPELAEAEKAEADMLMAYLPEQLSDDQVREIVKKAIADTGATEAKDMGKVIGAVMPQVKGKADGSRVSAIVKEELAR